MNKKSLLLTSCISLAVMSLFCASAYAQMAPQGTTTMPASAVPVSNMQAPPSTPWYQLPDNAFNPISTRLLSDPLFLPLRGQIFGTTAYTYTNPTSDHYNYLGAKVSSTSASNNLFDQTLAYGFTDAFSFHLSMGYGFDQSDTTNARTGISDTTKDFGFTNPTFGTTYRILDQAQHYPVDVDITANYAPSVFDSKAATLGQAGTVAAGRDVATLSVLVGREMKDFSIAGVATAHYEGTNKDEALGTGDTIKQDSYFDYGLTLETQTRFTNRISLDLDLGYTVPESKTTTINENTGRIASDALAGTFSVSTALNYQFIMNKLVGGLTYTYNDNSDTAANYTNFRLDTDQKNNSSNVFGARLQYLFF